MSRKSILSIRTMLVALTAFAFLFSLNSCNKDKKVVDRFKSAVMSLDNTTHTLEYEYDYWPEGGIRATGSHLASLISLKELEAMLPCPLYVSGPHHNGEWDLYNYDDFGHYNPQAIQYLANIATKMVSDKKFVDMSRPLIDKYLYHQMRIMMVLHDVVYDEDFYGKDGRDYLFSELIDNQGYSDEAFYLTNGIDLNDGTYIYSYFCYEMLYFWARRWSDGTIDQFYQALSTVYKAYYPEYEYHLEDYWYVGDWYEGDYYDGDYDYYEETTYTCELESDEPIADNERIKEAEAIEMVKNAVSKLDNTFDAVDDVFDYWPECGLRNTAGHLFSLISMRTLNRMLPCDLYVSGPHYVNRWNFKDPWDFGHYNPEAIKYLNKMASKIVADEKFVERTRPLVDEYVKRQMFILKSLYDGLNDKNICSDKNAVLEDIMSTQGWGYNEAVTSEFMEKMDNLNDDTFVYANTGEMFLYWWARRNADGTMDLFHEGLETIYNAYYPAE